MGLVKQWLINHFWHLPSAVLASLVYGFPARKLKIIGVTGTSGKTSTSHLIDHILKKSGYKTALLSTVSVPGLHVTNPEPFILQKILRQIKNKQVDYVVLEVTSHGLDQFRNWGTPFVYGVITNITHEHLDYHRTMEGYARAKIKLISQSQVAVLNPNDQFFKLAKQAVKGKILTFSDQPDFFAANINAATAVAWDLGIKAASIKAALASFPGVTGRMEMVLEKPFKIYIDFAHKPDALEKALLWLRPKTKGRLVAVFGCAGLRDRTKRPIMGGIAGRLADITILTAEDPRTEKANEIIDQIAAGFKARKKLYREPDRQKAINLAIKLARPGDVVACFGKSHEKSMCFGTIEYPWSEHQAVRKALALCNY
ncbi:hypothetical protein COW80_01675 [Candidatus Beckwithbacteria bacterium CG22_combo_CG10-13_8_21_14_all_01_47_9]|uniref:UDP-N-acetylmuramoyl-L-alanyl-D-glutamate--2, 6-diaminopimelate ligase n=5 Tax=Candidatus Beckwithiibacteriota TaxID=1752726 RepID=A0A2H0E1R9_9BACT|nr:MAG: hypothetical protein AUJ59_03060 [Candidatus Beckwithbacteria bacterium CG1_02_47_37]PIP52335.1 MAG: hypothetical protein COX09_02125 [Candidatus Beckwithbacteria bacterium CG23_combo_of_CG06-09_8_20_14_all_47_9]PIP88191.1 MAG: hypothetical protein COW80_01675 [Candidatus Beckwithbacteria bacterium CG22_combo_CG10-13_8_21_14_all_01_47_9]PJA21511.1 MAG: hypothetical protein COX59_04170 [Candidatus Beckwithbacteria bacterium CG_4_10_14_0_2_um_filter_47_25]PJC65985.1 MAG: hypothetical prot